MFCLVICSLSTARFMFILFYAWFRECLIFFLLLFIYNIFHFVTPFFQLGGRSYMKPLLKSDHAEKYHPDFYTTFTHHRRHVFYGGGYLAALYICRYRQVRIMITMKCFFFYNNNADFLSVCCLHYLPPEYTWTSAWSFQYFFPSKSLSSSIQAIWFINIRHI